MITSLTKDTQELCDADIKTAVELKDIGKKYPLAKNINKGTSSEFKEFWALERASLKVYKKEVLGIIGRNGAGKTTLLNIIVGILPASSGSIYTSGKVLGLFNLGVGFQDELTGRENIFLNGAILGATRKELNGRLDSIIEFSELGDFINMPLGTYSQGMRLRLGFSIIANMDFDILVIDEVLAVGDSLFQDKCFKRLMDFKRAGKALVITSQSMELIERLSDRAALLDHGRLLFCGEPIAAIGRYKSLLNSEKFFVGPVKKENKLITNTKKWADDISQWGKKFGTKDVEIDSVEFINRFGFKTNRIKTQAPLKIRVRFTVKNRVKDAHFGVAIFRNDGVYCYGPNTEFDGLKIPELKSGKGWFQIRYKKLLLAPGEYRVSIAIWDKNETVAFDYHNGCYVLRVTGYENIGNELLNMPVRGAGIVKRKSFFICQQAHRQQADTNQIKIESIKLYDAQGEEKRIFFAGQAARLLIKFSDVKINGKCRLAAAIFRSDDICCQDIVINSIRDRKLALYFPKLSLLPGEYKISVGIWHNLECKFLRYQDNICHFGIIFDRQYHGTGLLEHKWKTRTDNE
jgi:ABC-type polysaccharide/polyol phosphate transport system ATPase subunit